MAATDITPRVATRLRDFLLSVPEERRPGVAQRLMGMRPEKIAAFLDDPRAIALSERAPQKRDEPVTYFQTPWHLADYVTNGDEKNPRHLRVLDGLIIRGLKQGGVKSLVSMHPRSGKSRRLLRFGPLWLLHRDPTRRIGAFSYNPKVPGDASEYCRDIIMRHGPALGLSLRGRNTRLDWKVKGAEDTSYFAGGLQGTATGLGFTDLFIDDPLSGVAEAMNADIKKQRYEVIKGNLMTRLQPGGNLYVVATRWAEDDPIGLIMSDPEVAPLFNVIRFPALAEENDPLGRAPGEALWPDQWSVEALQTARKLNGDYWFSALYQGRPAPATGGLFDRSNVRYFQPSGIPGQVDLITDGGVLRKQIVLRFVTVDLAIGQNQENDFTCVATWDVTRDADLICRSVLMERFDGPTQGPVIIAEHRAFGGLHPLYVEAVQYQLALVQGLKAAGLPAEPVRPKGDKVARSNPAQALWRQNKVFFPREAPWHDVALKQVGDFNRGDHDDFVDCLSMAALVLMKALAPPESRDALLQQLIDDFDAEVPSIAA